MELKLVFAYLTIIALFIAEDVRPTAIENRKGRHHVWEERRRGVTLLKGDPPKSLIMEHPTWGKPILIHLYRNYTRN